MPPVSSLDPKRRIVLQGLAASLLAPGVLQVAHSATARDAWDSGFAPYAGPFNARFNGAIQTDNVPVEGQLPNALRGVLYRNGPARVRFNDVAYNHWFDGDGMLQAFHFSDGKLRHRGLLLRTPKLVEEEAAGRFLYSGFGTRVKSDRVIRNPNTLNVANTNLLAMNEGRDLYALWEAGSAMKINPETLEAQAFKTWSADTEGAPFSAHPKIAQDGTVWNFGYMPGSGKLIIYEIAADGNLKRKALLDAPRADMVHDFAITERFLVFLLMPLQFDSTDNGGTFLDRYRWQGQASLIALIVDKRDFSTRRFELPNGGLFHLGNAWEDGGKVHVNYARHPDILSSMQGLRLGQRNVQCAPVASWMAVELPLAGGTARQISMGLDDIEFPRVDSRFNGLKTSLAVMLQRTATMSAEVVGHNAVLAVRNGSVQRYNYGAGWIAEEHVFVPEVKSSREGTGWILGTAYHWPTEKTTLSVFDARNLSGGPIAQARLPYGLPLGFHGQFVAA